jgi:aspartyl/asparaginyl beta-hydroxylase (cupin superfamily)
MLVRPFFFRCTLTGFHTHPGNVEIYHDHQRVEWRNNEFLVVDLRNKR